MQLSERQQQTVAVALTILASLVIVSAAAGVAWLLVVFLRTFSNVFLPVAVAGILALVCQPYYQWLRYRRRLPVAVALSVLLLSLLTPLAAFAAFFGVILVQQLGDMLNALPVWWQQTRETIVEQWPAALEFLQENAMGQELNQIMQCAGGPASQAVELFANTAIAAGSGAISWAGRMLGWVVTPVYFVFFLTASPRELHTLEDYLPFLKPETRRDVRFLATEFVTILVTFFRGQLVIAFLQGVMLAITFSLVGLKYGLLLGLLLGFLNAIPYLGSMLGLAITLPLAYFQEGGGPATLAGVVVSLVIVQTIEGYVLTPKIMGSRTGLHPMAIIVAIFFWGSALNGILGMILAIPLTAFLVVLSRLAKEKYIKELV